MRYLQFFIFVNVLIFGLVNSQANGQELRFAMQNILESRKINQLIDANLAFEIRLFKRSEFYLSDTVFTSILANDIYKKISCKTIDSSNLELYHLIEKNEYGTGVTIYLEYKNCNDIITHPIGRFSPWVSGDWTDGYEKITSFFLDSCNIVCRQEFSTADLVLDTLIINKVIYDTISFREDNWPR